MSAAVESKLCQPTVRVRFSGQPGDSKLHEIFRFSFGNKQSYKSASATINVPLRVLEDSCQDEIWECDEPVRHGTDNDVLFAESDSLLMLHIHTPVSDASDITAKTAQLYSVLLESASQRGFPDIARTWNYIPQINSGDGDSERYRQFSAGRAQAFERNGYQTDCLPAGTAIGGEDDIPLHITILCTRSANQRIENPRQISAYEYPRQYGPRSPSFSRAVLLDTSQPLLLISGTASILGHKSMHTDQLIRQCEETATNIVTLRDAADSTADLTHSSDAGCLRLYLRHPEDYAEAVESLQSLLSDGCHLIALQGGICRIDLLVEVEAVYRERSHLTD